MCFSSWSQHANQRAAASTTLRYHLVLVPVDGAVSPECSPRIIVEEEEEETRTHCCHPVDSCGFHFNLTYCTFKQIKLAVVVDAGSNSHVLEVGGENKPAGETRFFHGYIYKSKKSDWFHKNSLSSGVAIKTSIRSTFDLNQSRSNESNGRKLLSLL